MHTHMHIHIQMCYSHRGAHWGLYALKRSAIEKLAQKEREGNGSI